MKKSYEEKLAILEEKEKQLKAQKQKLKTQHSKEERKKRTRYLIELGNAVCKVLNEDTVEGDRINNDDIDNFIVFLKTQNTRGNYFTKAMNRTPKSNN